MHENLIEQLRACSCAVSCNACPYGYWDCEEDLMKDAADAIEKLEKAVPRWIPVTEMLPEPYMRDAQGRIVHYLVMLMDENLILIASRTDKCWIYRGDGSRLKGVTHWMPLPSTHTEE